MTIHQSKHGPYILLTDIAPVERALLCAWLTGAERPAGLPVDAVELGVYLEFKRQLRAISSVGNSVWNCYDSVWKDGKI